MIARLLAPVALPLAGALLAALLGVSGWAWLQSGWLDDAQAERDRLARELSVQREITEQAQLAREVAQAHREREAKRAAELQRGIEALLTGDITNADSPIDPRIGAYLECVRRAEGGDTDRCAQGLDGPANAGADQ